jgi:hypothetical protein
LECGGKRVLVTLTSRNEERDTALAFELRTSNGELRI